MSEEESIKETKEESIKETKEETKEESKKETKKVVEEQNIVYIGRKPVMSYVLAIITSLNSPDVDEIVLKARGRSITTAVDVAEVTRRRFINDLKVDRIEIGTEEIEQEDGRIRNVSSMEIFLKR